uniref:CDGSH iron-sulfur domain-containing protein 2 homologue n=1 Tax=Phallusia mammillata TaxID=59560 RepID=A0A6F9D988_9ASCI|nr:CDGSH iron-sulfur domain-containing protein 2 homolog A-like [Phallusia mammillata]
MEVLSYLVRDTVPNYLKNVPIPRTFKGFLDLSVKDWAHLVSFSAVVGSAGYFAFKPYYDKYRGIQQEHIMNFNIEKSKEKVYDIIDVEDLAEKTNFCRCWRSKRWPYCDGSHNLHNQLTGDNVASIIMERKPRSG